MEISKRITSRDKLMKFGIKVLKLPEHKLEAALQNHDSIQGAVCESLFKWMDLQINGQEAYSLLLTELKKVSDEPVGCRIETLG